MIYPINNKPCAIPTGKSKVLYNSRLVGFKKSMLPNNTKSEIPSSNATILKIRVINNRLRIKVIAFEFSSKHCVFIKKQFKCSTQTDDTPDF